MTRIGERFDLMDAAGKPPMRSSRRNSWRPFAR